MSEFTLEQKALRVIELIASDDVLESCEMDLALDREIPQEDARELTKKLCQIYETAHSAIPEHSCYEVHDNWRKDTEESFIANTGGR